MQGAATRRRRLSWRPPYGRSVVLMAREKTAELLTVRQVLEELGGISRRTFYRWRELRLAPACIRLPNGELRVRRDVLNDWLADRAEGAAS